MFSCDAAKEQIQLPRYIPPRDFSSPDGVTDVALRSSDGHLFYYHRVYLVRHSEYFRVLLLGGMCEAQSWKGVDTPIDLGVRGELLHLVLCILDATIHPTDSKDSYLPPVPLTTFMDVLEVLDQYQLLHRVTLHTNIVDNFGVCGALHDVVHNLIRCHTFRDVNLLNELAELDLYLGVWHAMGWGGRRIKESDLTVEICTQLSPNLIMHLFGIEWELGYAALTRCNIARFSHAEHQRLAQKLTRGEVNRTERITDLVHVFTLTTVLGNRDLAEHFLGHALSWVATWKDPTSPIVLSYALNPTGN